MSTMIRTFVETVMDLIIDRILQFTDYFIVVQKITLSESMLFSLAAFRFIWVSYFGVSNENYDPVFGTFFWSLIFGALTTAHFLSFFSKKLTSRYYVLVAHSLVWCFITILAAWSGTIAPVVPTLAIITLTSIFITVRIYREARS